jgi:hypothetical protein
MKKDLNSWTSRKTETIKKRLIYVYLPSFEMVDKWKNLAKGAGVSISKFVTEHVENSLLMEEDEKQYESRLDLIEKNKELFEENQDLRKRSKMLDTVVERLEGELREYRCRPFLDDDFIGIREYQSEIIDLFKKRGTVRKNEILSLLDVDPKDRDTVKGIMKQLSGLESYGIISDVGAKWKWSL